MDALPPPSAPGLLMQEVGDRLVVHFPARRPWREGIPVAGFFVFWSIGGAAAINELVQKHDWGVLLFLAFWLFFEVLMAYNIARALFERESLIVTPLQLEVRRRLGRFSRSRFLETADVEDVTASVAPSDEGANDRTDYCVKITYGDKSVAVGEGMTRSEAEHVADAVVGHIRPRTWWEEDRKPRAAQPTADVPAPPKTQPIGVRAAVFPAIVVVAIGLIAYETLKSPDRPAKQDEKTSVTHPMPEPKQFRTARAYASAVTAWMLNSGDGKLVARPACAAHATWTRWTCVARVRFVTGPAAGQVSRFRCEPRMSGGVGCSLVTRRR